jgi:hypothetical protein
MLVATVVDRHGTSARVVAMEQPSREEVLALAEAVRELADEIRTLRAELAPVDPQASGANVDAALARAHRAAALHRRQARSRATVPTGADNAS